MQNFSSKYWYPMLAHLTWGFDFCPQLTLNGLYKKKLQFSIYSNETCFIQLYSSRRLIWAIVEPDWTKIERAMTHWQNVNFHVLIQKSTFFQFPEKFTEFVVQSLVSNVEKLEKNYGEIIFDLSLIVLWQFAIKFLKGR